MSVSINDIANQVIDDIFDDGNLEIALEWDKHEKTVADALQIDRQRCANLAKFHNAPEQLVHDIMHGCLVDLEDDEPYTW